MCGVLAAAVLVVCVLPWVRLPVRLYSQDDTARQAAARLCTCGRMLLRVAEVLVKNGPGEAFSWVKNAWRLTFDPSLGPGFTHTIETNDRIVSDRVAAEIGAMFKARDEAGERNAFAQSGQSIAYQHDFPNELQPALERLYTQLLQKINMELPALQLHPIKATFAERFYAVDYPGPTIELPFHYDCNDSNDYKAQILLEKSPGAPSLSVAACRETVLDQRPMDEKDTNICLFHPHSTYHGIPKGIGRRRVLICTFTRLVDDHRPLVCHADLISK